MNLKEQVEAKIKWCQDEIFRLYGKHVPVNEIVYDLDGKVGGEADYTRGLIRLHPIWLEQYKEVYINRTVVHEFAHLAHDILVPSDLSKARGNRKAHGKNWKSIMVALGASPEQYHNYSLEHIHSKQKYRNYMCTCCETTIQVSQIRHRRIIENRQTYYHTKCDAPIIFVGP